MPGSTYSKVQDTTRDEVCTKSVGKLRKLTATSRGLQNLLGADPNDCARSRSFRAGCDRVPARMRIRRLVGFRSEATFLDGAGRLGRVTTARQTGIRGLLMVGAAAPDWPGGASQCGKVGD